MGVTNRFKGLDLIDRVPENYGQSSLTLYRKLLSQPSPRKRNAKRQMVEEDLQIAEKREAKGRGEKKRYTISIHSSNE